MASFTMSSKSGVVGSHKDRKMPREKRKKSRVAEGKAASTEWCAYNKGTFR